MGYALFGLTWSLWTSRARFLHGSEFFPSRCSWSGAASCWVAWDGHILASVQSTPICAVLLVLESVSSVFLQWVVLFGTINSLWFPSTVKFQVQSSTERHIPYAVVSSLLSQYWMRTGVFASLHCFFLIILPFPFPSSLPTSFPACFLPSFLYPSLRLFRFLSFFFFMTVFLFCSFFVKNIVI